MRNHSIAPGKPKVILLDVYETLLNMSQIERRVNVLMASKTGYTVWFELFMQYCFVDNCTIQFNDFSSIAKATMQMTGKLFSRKVDEDDIVHILEHLKHVHIKEGVQEGLSMLHDQKFRIAALTNSPENTVRRRMESTGLISYFEVVLSAEHVKKYKPCIEVYEWAASKLAVELKDILLVSAHSWDIAGAANAGMQTAYIQHSKQMLYPLAPDPTYSIKDLTDFSNQMKVFSSKQL